MNRQSVIELQQLLNKGGYGPLDVDGRYGPKTRSAYNRMLTDADVGGRGTSLPVPRAKTNWWENRIALTSIATMVSMVLGLIGYAVDSQVLITLLTSLAGAVSAGVTLYGAIKGDPSVEPSSFIPERMRCKPVQTGDSGSQQSGLPTGPFFDDR